MKIFDVELNPEDHRKNSAEHQKAIFAHLNDDDKEAAYQQLQEALKGESMKGEPGESVQLGAGNPPATPIKLAKSK